MTAPTSENPLAPQAAAKTNGKPLLPPTVYELRRWVVAGCPSRPRWDAMNGSRA